MVNTMMLLKVKRMEDNTVNRHETALKRFWWSSKLEKCSFHQIICHFLHFSQTVTDDIFFDIVVACIWCFSTIFYTQRIVLLWFHLQCVWKMILTLSNKIVCYDDQRRIIRIKCVCKNWQWWSLIIFIIIGIQQHQTIKQNG